MTTIRDLLNELIEIVSENASNFDDPDEYDRWKEDLLEEYIEIIKERFVG